MHKLFPSIITNHKYNNADDNNITINTDCYCKVLGNIIWIESDGLRVQTKAG